MPFQVPFTTLKYLHNNYSCFVSNNDNKYDIIDSNRVPYIARYNKEILNFLSVADENGCIKLFKTYPKLNLVKEIIAQKSCIYDLEWLSSNQLACGGGDQFVSVYDITTNQRIAVMRGHTESVKSITSVPQNPFVIASCSRDGSILIFDIRCNKYQPTSEIISELSIEPDSCCIRAINNLQKAHFTENITSHNLGSRSILKSKTLNLNSPLSPSTNQHHNNSNNNHLNHHYYQHHHLKSDHKKSAPIASVVYQNDHLLVSAGVTDGLIKIWDTRKIYTSTAKKTCDPIPLYIFDNQINQTSNSISTPSSTHVKKGYSNLTFNSTRSHLYANCMNNSMFELNLLTYNQNHTRIINQPFNNKTIKNYHTNSSNFIKSSISQCDNFIVTGSSDFNAYIYSTNISNNMACFKRFLPVIVLKGHTNEVTTVDWNPFDSNQLVTCSDDNTIRLWNVKREIDLIETKECNFLKAETIDEFKKEENLNNSALSDGDDLDDLLEKLNENYIGGIQFNNRIYNKYRPHSTGVFDDHLFVNYEHKNFMRKPKTIKSKIDFEEMDIEKELCLKYENINIDKVCTNSTFSPTSSMLNSIENELMNSDSSNNNRFKQLKSLLSDLPINVLPQQENVNNNTQEEKQGSQIHTQKNLSSVFLTLSQSQNKPIPKTIKRRINKTKKSPDNNLLENNSNHLINLTKTPVTGKKRSLNSTLKDEIESNCSSNLEQPKTPKSKKRLIMADNIASQATASTSHSQTKPTCSSNNTTTGTRTILDYFTFKPQGSK